MLLLLCILLHSLFERKSGRVFVFNSLTFEHFCLTLFHITLLCVCVAGAHVRSFQFTLIWSPLYLNDTFFQLFFFFSLVGFTLFPLFGWSFTQCSRLEGTNKESRQQPYKWHQLILKDRLIQSNVWFQASHRLVLFFLFGFAYRFLAYVFCFHNQKSG